MTAALHAFVIAGLDPAIYLSKDAIGRISASAERRIPWEPQRQTNPIAIGTIRLISVFFKFTA
jgi:hypothetical protein